MPEIIVLVEVSCARCSRTLSPGVAQGNPRLIVDPCEDCEGEVDARASQAGYDSGYDQGYKEGYDQGVSEGEP